MINGILNELSRFKNIEKILFSKRSVMPLFFTLDNRQRFTVEVMLGKDLYTKNLSEIINLVTADSKKIKQLYNGFISKEGRIHGQGRVQLVEGLDELFGVLLLLRKNLNERTPEELLSTIQLNKRVSIEIRINKFIAKGTLNRNDILMIMNFNESYDVLILQKVKDLLLTCKNTLEAEEPSPGRYMELFNVFDGIFYHTIVLRYGVENLLIDR
jgi:hypothetical protein